MAKTDGSLTRQKVLEAALQLIDRLLLFEEFDDDLGLEGRRISFAHGRNCTL